MYGIFTYIWLIFMGNVSEYTIHGSYGFWPPKKNKSAVFFPVWHPQTLGHCDTGHHLGLCYLRCHNARVVVAGGLCGRRGGVFGAWRDISWSNYSDLTRPKTPKCSWGFGKSPLFQGIRWWNITLPETNIAPENRPSQYRKVVFQPSIFRGYVIVSGRVYFGQISGWFWLMRTRAAKTGWWFSIFLFPS